MEGTSGFRFFDDFEEVLKQFKNWEVDSEGNIKYLGHTGTEISKSELTSGNLLTHFMMKDLGNDAEKEFYFAFIQALVNAGYTSLEIDLTDIHKSIKVK